MNGALNLLGQLTVGGLFAVLIVYVVFRYGPKPSRQESEKKPGVNGESGQMTVSFWKNEIGEVVDKKLDARLAVIHQKLDELIRHHHEH